VVEDSDVGSCGQEVLGDDLLVRVTGVVELEGRRGGEAGVQVVCEALGQVLVVLGRGAEEGIRVNYNASFVWLWCFCFCLVCFWFFVVFVVL